MSIDIPSAEDFAELTRHRNAASVSFYLPAAVTGASDRRPPIAHDTEAVRIALRSAAGDALGELAGIGASRADRERLSAGLQSLDTDRSFWANPARSIAVFASPEGVRVFRLMNELPRHTAIGDRFDVGPLIRATTFDHRGYVLAVTEGEVRLLALEADGSAHRIELPALPEDAADVLAPTATGGRFDRRRADGTLGPKVEQRRYCSLVQDAVLEAIDDGTVPLVLAAAPDLEPAYREINSYGGLLPEGIGANPASLSLDELAERGRAVLEGHHAAELDAWRERFETLRATGLASTQLSEVARAATAGLVDSLLFDLESDEEGGLDEAGTVTTVPEPGPTSYGLVDEVAVRVLRTGGSVKAVRRQELPDDSPVAAVFRAAP